jgi:hypothetical protein
VVSKTGKMQTVTTMRSADAYRTATGRRAVNVLHSPITLAPRQFRRETGRLLGRPVAVVSGTWMGRAAPRPAPTAAANRVHEARSGHGWGLPGKSGIKGYVTPRTRLVSALLVGRFAEPS